MFTVCKPHISFYLKNISVWGVRIEKVFGNGYVVINGPCLSAALSHVEDTLFDLQHCGHINAVCGMAVCQQQAELSSENLTVSEFVSALPIVL